MSALERICKALDAIRIALNAHMDLLKVHEERITALESNSQQIKESPVDTSTGDYSYASSTNDNQIRVSHIGSGGGPGEVIVPAAENQIRSKFMNSAQYQPTTPHHKVVVTGVDFHAESEPFIMKPGETYTVSAGGPDRKAAQQAENQRYVDIAAHLANQARRLATNKIHSMTEPIEPDYDASQKISLYSPAWKLALSGSIMTIEHYKEALRDTYGYSEEKIAEAVASYGKFITGADVDYDALVRGMELSHIGLLESVRSTSEDTTVGGFLKRYPDYIGLAEVIGIERARAIAMYLFEKDIWSWSLSPWPWNRPFTKADYERLKG